MLTDQFLIEQILIEHHDLVGLLQSGEFAGLLLKMYLGLIQSYILFAIFQLDVTQHAYFYLR